MTAIALERVSQFSAAEHVTDIALERVSRFSAAQDVIDIAPQRVSVFQVPSPRGHPRRLAGTPTYTPAGGGTVPVACAGTVPAWPRGSAAIDFSTFTDIPPFFRDER